MFCSGLVHNLQQVQCLVKVEFKSTKYGLCRLSQTFAFVMVMEWHWERGMTVKRNLCGILETFQDGFQDRWCPADQKTSWPHLVDIDLHSKRTCCRFCFLRNWLARKILIKRWILDASLVAQTFLIILKIIMAFVGGFRSSLSFFYLWTHHRPVRPYSLFGSWRRLWKECEVIYSWTQKTYFDGFRYSFKE